jgi:hypothetical protein
MSIGKFMAFIVFALVISFVVVSRVHHCHSGIVMPAMKKNVGTGDQKAGDRKKGGFVESRSPHWLFTVPATRRTHFLSKAALWSCMNSPAARAKLVSCRTRVDRSGVPTANKYYVARERGVHHVDEKTEAHADKRDVQHALYVCLPSTLANYVSFTDINEEDLTHMHVGISFSKRVAEGIVVGQYLPYLRAIANIAIHASRHNAWWSVARYAAFPTEKKGVADLDTNLMEVLHVYCGEPFVSLKIKFFVVISGCYWTLVDFRGL